MDPVSLGAEDDGLGAVQPLDYSVYHIAGKGTVLALNEETMSGQHRHWIMALDLKRLALQQACNTLAVSKRVAVSQSIVRDRFSNIVGRTRHQFYSKRKTALTESWVLDLTSTVVSRSQVRIEKL